MWITIETQKLAENVWKAMTQSPEGDTLVVVAKTKAEAVRKVTEMFTSLAEVA